MHKLKPKLSGYIIKSIVIQTRNLRKNFREEATLNILS